MENNLLEKTIDNGVIEEVQISPIGTFYGSDKDGNPIKQIIKESDLSALAEKLNSGDDILCDIDHNSTKLNRDSKAAGWFSNFVVKPLKGLFAKLSLTKYGKELIENREYRFTSPVFTLDENNQPNDLFSVALTNTPAFKNAIKPILNQEPNDENLIKDILSMDINELKNLIIETISEIEAEKQKAEIVEEIKEEVVENEGCENKPEEKTMNEETVVEEKVEVVETKTEKPTVEEEKKDEEKEIIKIETLNSAPISLNQVPAWKNLKGKEFFSWLEKHPKGV